MASDPITSWQIDGETVEAVADFIFFFGLNITADGDFSHEIKRCLLLGSKAMTNLDSILFLFFLIFNFNFILKLNLFFKNNYFNKHELPLKVKAA